MKKQTIILGIVESDCSEVVMIPEDEARSLAALYEAMGRARTWGEFKRLAPEEHYRDAVERTFGGDEEPEADRPFDSMQIYGFGDGDWPAWPAQQMLRWVPRKVQTRFGRTESSVLNGPFLSLRGEAIDEIAAAMKESGYSCRRDDALIADAHGL